MPEEQLAALQGELLKNQVKYVYERQPVYRKRMERSNIRPEDIKSIEDIRLLPFTDKEDLTKNHPFGMLAAPEEKVIRLHATSGTTENMAFVPCTKKDIDLFTEGVSRAFAMQGCTNKSRVLNTLSYSMFIGGIGAQYAAENIGAMLIPTSTGNSTRQISFLKNFKVTHLVCTPSFARRLIKEKTDLGLTKSDFNLKSCLLTGERTDKSLENALMEEFGAKAFDVYGSTEMTNVFAACRHNSGKHTFGDLIYAEIVDENGKPVPDGEYGELVVTTLQKEGLPLIRYKTHDITCFLKGSCPCGRTGKRIGEIIGRTDDLINVHGSKLFPSQFESVILKFDFLSGNFKIDLPPKGSTLNPVLWVETKKEDPSPTEKNTFEKAVCSAINLKISFKYLPQGVIPDSDGNKKKSAIMRTSPRSEKQPFPDKILS